MAFKMAAGSGILALFSSYGVAFQARQFELKAESPKFWDLFTQGSQLEKIATGFGFTEGPVWDPHGFLYVSDEEKNKLSRVYPDGRVETVLEIGDPDGSTLDAEGRLITTASVLRSIMIWQRRSGTASVNSSCTPVRVSVQSTSNPVSSASRPKYSPMNVTSGSPWAFGASIAGSHGLSVIVVV